MPPSSLHSFLRKDVESHILAGISIADYNHTFKNSFYHSVFDTPANMNIKFPSDITESQAADHTTLFARQLQRAVTAVAKTVFSISSNNSLPTNFDADLQIINKLVYCFYRNTTCAFFKSILSESQWSKYVKLLETATPKYQLTFYTSVNENAMSGKWISLELLKYFARNREIENFNATECDKNADKFKEYESESGKTIRNLKFVDNRTCVASSVYLVSSVSPVFDNFYASGVLLNADKYASWTESSWNGVAIQIRLFMFPDRSVEILTLVMGIISLLLAFLLTYLVNKYSKRILGSSKATSEQQTGQIFT
jgi:hypothetical protein